MYLLYTTVLQGYNSKEVQGKYMRDGGLRWARVGVSMSCVVQIGPSCPRKPLVPVRFPRAKSLML